MFSNVVKCTFRDIVFNKVSTELRLLLCEQADEIGISELVCLMAYFSTF